MTPEDFIISVLFLVVGIVINHIYFREQIKDGKRLRNLILTGFRIQQDAHVIRGFPIENPDGTWSVEWRIDVQEPKIDVSDSATVGSIKNAEVQENIGTVNDGAKAEVIRTKKEEQS